MTGVLVTRPEPEADALAAELRRRGHIPVIEPLLTIRFTGAEALDLDGVQGLICTSANGVRAAAQRTSRRDLPVFAVGGKTGAEARGAGFEDVTVADGDGRSLAELLADRIHPAQGRLLHIGGAALAVDIAALLAPSGIIVDRVVGYEAVAATALSSATTTALDDGIVTHCLFFSPRTARTFVSLLKRHERTDSAGALTACCLSDAVAAALKGSRWRNIRVAGRRDTSSVLDLLPR